MSIRVVIAEEYQLLADALKALLEQDEQIEIVASCCDGAVLVEAVEHHMPDVLVMSQQLPNRRGTDALRELRARGIETSVVLIAGSISEVEVLEALRLGVSGMLVKSMPGRLLVQCVKKVFGGGQWVEKNATSRALQQLLRHEESATEHASTLSIRELDVLRAVSRGLRNRQVAEKLFISESTVKVHLNKIFDKLHIGSRVELSLYAQQNGLI